MVTLDFELSKENEQYAKDVLRLRNALPDETFRDIEDVSLRVSVEKDERNNFMGCRIYPVGGRLDLSKINRPREAKTVGGLEIYTLKDGTNVRFFVYQDEAYYFYDSNPERGD